MATKKRSAEYLAQLYRKGVGTGKPPKYKNAEQLRDKIEKYFASITTKETWLEDEKEFDAYGNNVLVTKKEVTNVNHSTGEPVPTMTGMALFLGFADKQSLWDYEKTSPEYSYLIRAAKSIIERYHEIRVATSDKAQGSMFVLQNMGWSTKAEVKDTTERPAQVFKIGDVEISF